MRAQTHTDRRKHALRQLTDRQNVTDQSRPIKVRRDRTHTIQKGEKFIELGVSIRIVHC